MAELRQLAVYSTGYPKPAIPGQLAWTLRYLLQNVFTSTTAGLLHSSGKFIPSYSTGHVPFVLVHIFHCSHAYQIREGGGGTTYH